MRNTHQIVADIGIEVLQENLGVGYTAIKNAEARGFLPAAWFNVVERLCMERGMECPRSLFNFKGADR